MASAGFSLSRGKLVATSVMSAPNTGHRVGPFRWEIHGHRLRTVALGGEENQLFSQGGPDLAFA